MVVGASFELLNNSERVHAKHIKTITFVVGCHYTTNVSHLSYYCKRKC